MAAGAGGGRRKISFAAVPEEDDEDEEAGEQEEEDPIEDPDLAAPASSAEVRTGHSLTDALQTYRICAVVYTLSFSKGLNAVN